MKIFNAGRKTPQFPEVATASVSGPEVVGTSLRYTFSGAIGTKG